jgi:hypothetical protein
VARPIAGVVKVTTSFVTLVTVAARLVAETAPAVVGQVDAVTNRTCGVAKPVMNPTKVPVTVVPPPTGPEVGLRTTVGLAAKAAVAVPSRRAAAAPVASPARNSTRDRVDMDLLMRGPPTATADRVVG